MALRGDRVLVRRGQPAVANDDPALDEQVARGLWPAERERRDRVRARSGERQAVHAEERDVGALARLERADVVRARGTRRRLASRSAGRRVRVSAAGSPAARATSMA